MNKPMIHFTKDAPEKVTLEKSIELVTTEISTFSEALKKSREDQEAQYRELSNQFGGVKTDNEEVKAAVKKHADEYAAMVARTQSLEDALDSVKKELDSPRYGGSDATDKDRVAAIELQRRIHVNKGGRPEEFKEETDKLVVAKDYRSAANKLVTLGGIESRERIVSTFFNDAERKAFDAASMDTGFFMPEMLGIEIDCNILCSEMVDLYDSVSVSRSNYMYPRINSYGDIGQYSCDAKCDAEFGPEGNIQYLQGQTYDWRGVFCFLRKVLQEANYPLLDFMFRSAARSYGINRNRALISGDGINEPKGWLTQSCFGQYATAGLAFNHVDARRFLSSAPVEYGPVVATMHQNMFAYLAAQVDADGRFIFGDGMMTYSPDDTAERIRISNCLPDATAGGTKGNAAAPFVAGDFIMAAGNWNLAYTAVEKRPLWMEQHIGGSSAWCVKYQFGAEDGGFVKCCDAARTLVVGA